MLYGIIALAFVGIIVAGAFRDSIKAAIRARTARAAAMVHATPPTTAPGTATTTTSRGSDYPWYVSYSLPVLAVVLLLIFFLHRWLIRGTLL